MSCLSTSLSKRVRNAPGKRQNSLGCLRRASFFQWCISNLDGKSRVEHHHNNHSTEEKTDAPYTHTYIDYCCTCMSRAYIHRYHHQQGRVAVFSPRNGRCRLNICHAATASVGGENITLDKTKHTRVLNKKNNCYAGGDKQQILSNLWSSRFLLGIVP